MRFFSHLANSTLFNIFTDKRLALILSGFVYLGLDLFALKPICFCFLLQPLKLSPEVIQENVELMMELLPIRQQWTPEAVFNKLGGMQLLCQLLALSSDWSNYTGKLVISL